MMVWLWMACVAIRSEDRWTGWSTTYTTTGGDTGGAAAGEDRPRVLSIGIGCSDEGWQGAVEFDGWTADASLILYDTQTIVYEEHPLPLVGTDPEGGWDRRAIGPLIAGVPEEEQQAGVSTRFGCEDEPALTFFVLAWDDSGAVTDCGMWGADTDGGAAWVAAHVREVAEIGGCRLWL